MHFFELVNAQGTVGFLVEVTLKGTLILAAAALATVLLKSASASVRHLIWSTALVLLLVLPAFVAFAPPYELAVLPPDVGSMARSDLPMMPSEDDAIWSERMASSSSSIGMEAGRDLQKRVRAEAPNPTIMPELDAVPVAEAAEMRSETRSFDWRTALFALWMIGAALVSLRYAFAWIALRRIQRRAVPVSDVRLRLLVKRTAAAMGLRRRIRVVWGAEGSMPLTFGCVRPTVLLPEGAKEWTPERLMVVLKHELAHVKRWDCLVQAIVYFACTLYWFNPIVWIAAAESHREREMACDDYVLSMGSEGSDYAGHLLEIARSLQGPRLSGMTTIAMARRSELEGRLLAILSPTRSRARTTAQGALTTFAILGCFVLTIAALRPVAMQAKSSSEPLEAEIIEPADEYRAAASPEIKAKAVSVDPEASITVTAQVDEQYIAEASAVVAKAAATLEASLNRLLPRSVRLNGSVAARIDQSVDLVAAGRLEIVRADTIPLEQIRRLRVAGVDVDYIEEMASVGFDRLTVEQLISLAHAGVDAEYVRRLRDAGFDDLDPDDLIDLGFAGVDVEDVQVWADLGYRDLSSRELIKLAHAGVDASDVRALAEAGYGGLSPSELVQFGHANVDPEFIRSMQQLGFTDLSSRDLIRLSHADVDVEFIQQMRKAGYDGLEAEDLIRLSHANVDKRFIRELNEMGLKDLDVSDLIKLGHADIDATFIREMRKSGYVDLSVDEIIQIGYADVDADYIAELARAGVSGLAPMDLVQLRHAGIDADEVADLSQAGLKHLSTADLIQLGFADVDGQYISEMASVGLTGLSASDLVLLAHAGVDADDVRQMREMGVETTDPDKIVHFKYIDIDPDYVERIRRALDR